MASVANSDPVRLSERDSMGHGCGYLGLLFHRSCRQEHFSGKGNMIVTVMMFCAEQKEETPCTKSVEKKSAVNWEFIQWLFIEGLLNVSHYVMNG